MGTQITEYFKLSQSPMYGNVSSPQDIFFMCDYVRNYPNIDLI